MRFCFIVEAQYRHDSMPLNVLNQLLAWNHEVDILEPQSTTLYLPDLFSQHYDAYVLKTVSDGPGLTLLEAAEAAGIPTINRSQAIRHVRNKAVAMAIAMAHGLPTPQTYFLSDPRLLYQIPDEQFPLVLKPNNGSSCRDIYYISDASELSCLDLSIQNPGFWLAQHYEENRGFDTKLYVAGEQVFAVAKRSPLHPDISVEKRLIPLTSELRHLALTIGQLFGLDIYGLDIVETAHGPMIVDVNDFPSFGNIPEAEKLLANCVLETTRRYQRLRVEQPIPFALPQTTLFPLAKPSYVHFSSLPPSFVIH